MAEGRSPSSHRVIALRGYSLLPSTGIWHANSPIQDTNFRFSFSHLNLHDFINFIIGPIL